MGHREKRLRQRELEFFSKFSWTQDTQSFSFENSIKIKVRDKLSTFWGWNDFSLVHWRWFLFYVRFVIKVELLNKWRLFFDHEIVSIVVIVLTLLIFRHFVLCTSCLQYYSIPFVHIMSTIHLDQILINVHVHIMSTMLLNIICAHNVSNTFISYSDQCAHYEHNGIWYSK